MVEILIGRRAYEVEVRTADGIMLLRFDAPELVLDSPPPSDSEASRSRPHLAVDWPVTL